MKIVNNVLNPSAEGATASLENQTGCTVTLSSTAATGWPVQGTKSYQMSHTVTTDSTARLRLVERVAAVAGDGAHVRGKVRPASGNTGTRRYTVSLLFYNTAPGVTAGTILQTVTQVVDAAPGSIFDIQLSSVAPVGTLSVGFSITRTGSVLGAAITDITFADLLLLANAPSPDPTITAFYPGYSPYSFWSGTADASTSYTYDFRGPTVTTSDDPPSAHILWTGTDLADDVAEITLYRIYDGKTTTVRQSIRDFAVGGYATDDVEIPTDVTVSYRAEVFRNDGISLGFTPTTDVLIAGKLGWAWISNPLDPARPALGVELRDTAGSRPKPAAPGQTYRVGLRTVALVGQRAFLTDLDMSFFTNTADERAAVNDLVDTSNGLILIRPGPKMMIPVQLYCWAKSITPDDFNLPGDMDEVEWETIVDELSPFEGEAGTALHSWQIYIDAFPTWNDFNSAYLTWLDAINNPPEV